MLRPAPWSVRNGDRTRARAVASGLLALTLLAVPELAMAAQATGLAPGAGVEAELAARRRLPAAVPAPDPRTVRRHGAGTAYPQAGWLVVHIEGEPYERGYQHGRLLGREIEQFIEAQARFHGPRSPADGWKALRTLTNALFLRQFDAELLEEMQGIADGAAAAGALALGQPIELLDIVTLNAEIEASALDDALARTPVGLEGKVFREPAAANRPRPPHVDHCSAFLATGPATADGKLVVGHLTMWNLDHARFFNVWLDIQPAHGHRVRMQTYPGGIQSGTDFYLNDAGLVVCETTIPQTAFEPRSRPLAGRIRRALQDSDSIDGVVAALRDGNNGLYANEWLIGDAKTDEAAMFELGTHRSRLWRSSRGEWFGGTPGFYWGCNTTKDLDVRLETVPGVLGKPANVVFHPEDRDRAWLGLYDAHHGRIDAAFGVRALTTPPLAAFRSIDAKVATSDQIRRLEAHAVFGPPLGRVWEPTAEDLRRDPELVPLFPNDWTLLGAVEPPPASDEGPEPVDLLGPSPRARAHAPQVEGRRPPAWHGTILPGEPGDLWLASAFSDFEKLVALERGLEDDADRDERLAVARFAATSQALAARARLGRDVPLTAIRPDLRDDAPAHLAAGKGVLLLDALRRTLGAEPFDAAMDRFGRAHAGQAATTDTFFAAMAEAHGESLDELRAAGLGPEPWSAFGPEVAARAATGRAWTVASFEHEPEQAVIVVGTLAEADANRAAAGRLQDQIRRRWANVTVPVVTDTALTADDRRGRHLLLVGRPATNRIAAELAGAWPLQFGAGSFTLDGTTYAHPASAVIAAGPHPDSPSRSVVLFAGLGGGATWQAVGSLPNPELEPLTDSAEVVVIEAGTPPRRLVPAAADPVPAGVAGP